MEESLILDLLLNDSLCNYQNEIEKEENNNFAIWVKRERDNLENTLTKEQIELLDKYLFQLTLREEFISYRMKIKVLNYGIKIGMEIQKAFDDDRE